MKGLRQPLAGLRVLVGRARHQASALSAELRAAGAVVSEIPFIEIRRPGSYQPLDAALRHISEYHWLILTSVNGVDALAARMRRLKISSRRLAGLRVATIGPSTRRAAEELGLKVSIVPKQYVAESVVESLRGKVHGRTVLLARAKVARDVIPRELEKMGAKVTVVEAYRTVAPRASKKQLQVLLNDPERRPHWVVFTSSSTVRNFIHLVGQRGQRSHPLLDGIKFASIGPITSATLRERGQPVHLQAAEYTIPGLVKAIADYARSRV
jgi:uroporphyrinogen-III synthase